MPRLVLLALVLAILAGVFAFLRGAPERAVAYVVIGFAIAAKSALEEDAR